MKNKIKITKARMTILSILKKINKPLDVSEIILKIKKAGAKINRVTVFRNVNFLVKNGLISKVELNEGKYRYEISTLPHHHHLVCKNCRKLIDIKDEDLHDQIEKISNKVNLQYHFVIEEHKVEFFGKCKDCKNK